MPMSDERFEDRIEFLKAFLALKSAIQTVTVHAGLSDNPEVVERVVKLDEMMNDMISRMQRDQQ